MRTRFVVTFLSLCLAACTPVASMPDGSVPAGIPCVDDTDCPDTQYFTCDTQMSLCRPSCRNNDECNQRPEQFALELCANPLGCWCDEGRCFAAVCTSDAECGALACRNGACVEPPLESAVASCAIVPDFVIASLGQPLRFDVTSWTAENEPIVVPSGARWASLGAVLGGGPTQGHSATFTAQVVNANVTPAVRATIGATQCEARVLVLPEPTVPSAMIVSVVDERTGRPIAGAQLMVSTPDGAIVQQGGADSRPTNADGWLEIDGLADQTLSVFHSEFSYQTIVNVPPTARVVRVELKRNPLDRLGGHEVSLEIPPTSNVHLARVGLSSSTDLISFALTDEYEPTVPVDIRIGSAINQPDTPLPLGTFLAFGGDDRIKPVASAFGTNGVCRASTGEVDEAQVSAGTCGAQSAWVLSADVPLGSIPLDTGGQFSFLQFLGRGSWYFPKYQSSVSRDVQFPLRGPPVSGVGDANDRSNFTSETRAFGQLRLALQASVRPPKNPAFGRGFLDDVLVASVALAPGRGAVPIGLGHGLRSFGDTVREPIRLRTAPLHHGFEAAQGALLTQAIGTTWSSDRTVGRATSAVLTRFAPGTIGFDRDEIDQRGEPFPALLEDARWNPTSAVDRGLRARTFVATNRNDATTVRVVFEDTLGSRWEVFVDPLALRFTLPTPPGALRDRVFDVSLAGGRPARLKVETLRFGATRYSEWVAAPQLRDQVQHLTAWSRLEVREKRVTILSPVTGGALGADRLIHLGIEGQAPNVRVSFLQGTGCADIAAQSEQVVVPAACSGGSVGIRVELLGDDGASLAPVVAAQVNDVSIR